MKKYVIEIKNDTSGIYVQHIVFANSHEEAREKLQTHFDSISALDYHRMVTRCESN